MRLKLSWLGAPWRRSTISASSSSCAAAKSAMSTQDFAPHKVAASPMNSIAERSWRALKSRGSRTSRKIEISVSMQALPNQESLLQNQLFLPGQYGSTQMRFPYLRGGQASPAMTLGEVQ